MLRPDLKKGEFKFYFSPTDKKRDGFKAIIVGHNHSVIYEYFIDDAPQRPRENNSKDHSMTRLYITV